MVNASSFAFVLTPRSRVGGFGFVGGGCGTCVCVASCMSGFCCATPSWHRRLSAAVPRTCETPLPFSLAARSGLVPAPSPLGRSILSPRSPSLGSRLSAVFCSRRDWSLEAAVASNPSRSVLRRHPKTIPLLLNLSHKETTGATWDRAEGFKRTKH